MIKNIFRGGLIAILFAIISFAPSFANVNNFEFSSFKGDYYLSKNAKGESVVEVKETFVANFPNYNQNKGMVRAIPVVYQNHPVNFELLSVKRNGKSEPIYAQRVENNNKVIETGTDDYLLGPQEFTFIYRMTNVTQDANSSQEFYWNVIGNQFSQPFQSAEASIKMSPQVDSGFTKELRCFAGSTVQKINCQNWYDPQTQTAHFKLTEPLPPESSLTVVAQFKPETFSSYKPTLWESFLINYVFYVIGLASWAVAASAIVIYNKNQTPKIKKAIIPEYLPPKNLSVMQASGLTSASRTVLPAELIDLAVRHKILIIESEKKLLLGSKKIYKIELIADEGLFPDEKKLLIDMLGSLDKGSTYTMDSQDYKVGAMIRKVVLNSQTKMLVNKDYLQKSIAKKTKVPSTIMVLIIIALPLTLKYTEMLNLSPAGGGLMFAFLSLFVGITGLAIANGKKLYTEKGREVEHYLSGLKMYIKLAEAERLKYLQSPSGADRTPVDTGDQDQIIKLYERVLPYAVLFNLEKEWSKVLEVKYQDASSAPSWYAGDSVLNGVMIGSLVSSFSSSTASSFSAPSSSSSGSGISGGFAGGGGGGGGGGGR